MDCPRKYFRLVAFFLLLALLKGPRDVEGAIDAHLLSVHKDTVDKSSSVRGDSNRNLQVERIPRDSQNSFHSRILTQRTDRTQSNDDITCRLSSFQLRQWFNESTQQWIVTDQVLKEVDNNIQAIVNCTSENDVVVFQSRTRIVPASSVTIPRRITLKGDSNARFNCPRSGAFLISTTASFKLENMRIVGCNGTSSIISINPNCRGNRIRGTTVLSNVSFVGNTVLEQAHIINMETSCVELELSGITLRENKCIGTHCVLLGRRNTLRDLQLLDNEGSNDISLDSSIFSSSRGSETVIVNMTSKRNQIRSFHIANSSLSITDSSFVGNKQDQFSVGREDSIRGGVVFSNGSLVSISSTIFEQNQALNGGAVFAVSSNISIRDCKFLENDAEGGNGGALYGHHNSSFNISSSQFSKNLGYNGAVLYSNYTRRVSIMNSSIMENESNHIGSVFIGHGVATIESCEFLQNEAVRSGGGIFISNADLTVRNSTFVGNNASSGGACFFGQYSTVSGNGLLLEANGGLSRGGGLHLSSGSHMEIRNSLFQNNYASTGGGAIYTDRHSNTVLNRVEFLNNTSVYSAGGVEISTGNFTGKNLRFKNNTARGISGGAVFFNNATVASVSRSLFQDNEAGFGGGAISFSNVISGLVFRSTFLNNSCAINGGSIEATSSNLTLSESSFRADRALLAGSIYLHAFTNSSISACSFLENEAGLTGGAVLVDSNSTISVFDSSFKENRGAIGGALTVQDNSNLSMTGTVFARNSAASNGALYLSEAGNSTITDSRFVDNTCSGAGGAIHVSETSKFSLSTSKFSGNTAMFQGGALTVHGNCSLEVSVVTFDGNSALYGGSLYIHSACNATISDCSFTNNMAINNGGAILLNDTSTMSLSHSTFSGNQATLGGALHFIKNCSALLENNRLIGNAAAHHGGAIHLKNSSMSVVATTLISNLAPQGGALFSSEASLKISNSSFMRNLASKNSGALLMAVTDARLKDVRIQSNQALEECGGFQAIDGSNINASNLVVMSNSAGAMGGGMCIANASSLLCDSCSIVNNNAFSGAGLYVFSNHSVSVVAQVQNSRFENNSAQSYGGGLVLAAPQDRRLNCTLPSFTCGHVVLLNTSFSDNHANDTGAAILAADANRVLIGCEYNSISHRNFLEEQEFKSLSTVHPERLCRSWKRNRLSDANYAGVVGTYGQVIELTIGRNNKVKLSGNIETGLVLEHVSSGKQLPTINITILDGFGAGPAPTVMPSFGSSLSSPSGFFSGYYPANISGGSGNFSDVAGFAIPGNYTLEIEFDNPAFETVKVTVIVRECQIGEEPTRDRLTCQECDSVNYNFNPQIPSGCTQCPEGGNCTGRFIAPEKGHWHKSPCHDTVQKCLIEEACTYHNRLEVLTNFTSDSTDCNINETTIESYNDALCNEGYKGLLCGSCKDSFGLSARFLCLSCPRTIVSVLALIGVTLYLLVASSLTIRGCIPADEEAHSEGSTSTQSSNVPEAINGDVAVDVEMVESKVEGTVPPDSAKETQGSSISRTKTTSYTKNNKPELTRWKTTELIKIIINFLQTTAVAANVNVQWTEGVLGVYETSEYVGVLTTSASSGPIDCLMSSDSATTRSLSRMLMTILVPGIVILIFLLFWSGLAFKRKKGINYFCKRSFLSIIAVTYISYLGLTQLAVRVFYCVDVFDSIDPFLKTKNSYWAVDTAVACYGKGHIGPIIVAVALLLFISLGFPLISAFLLTTTQEQVRQSSTWRLETMGFLYRAFKEKFVYWESVVMLRKAFISVIVVFAYPLGGQIQGLLAALVLIFGLYFHQMCAPFRKEFRTLNHYESISLLVSCVTFVLGQFFNAEKSSNTTRVLIAVVIIVANASFFAFMALVLVGNVIEQLRESLQTAKVNVSQDAAWWLVIKVYITFRLSKLCHAKK